jgi:hypothetical protein
LRSPDTVYYFNKFLSVNHTDKLSRRTTPLSVDAGDTLAGKINSADGRKEPTSAGGIFPKGGADCARQRPEPDEENQGDFNPAGGW